MKVVILAGGLGTRISEESHLKPKPMIEIGGRPILWHIMKEYSHYGFNEFIICLGYKQHVVKEYFADYYLYSSDVTFDLTDNSCQIHNNHSEPWKVTLVDTGLKTMTGGRIKRIRNYVGDETFMMTYGDGVSDVNLKELLKFHKGHGRTGTITAISVDQRFGVIDIKDDNTVQAFDEKAEKDSSVVNGGYMVFEPEIFDYIEGDGTVFEKSSLVRLAEDGKLMAYHHRGFWQCMDTQREKQKLEELWAGGKAPWKVWD